jgi:hypothetical protein
VLGEDQRLMRYRLARGALAIAALILLTSCSGDAEPQADPEASVPSPLPSATEAPRPKEGACYRLSFDAALAYTSDAAPKDCRREHTSVTFAVGELDTVVGGHLVAVDSQRVKEQVADTCPRLLGDYVGGSLTQQRLSMLRAVWFTPTVEESDAGADWYRCDVIAVAGGEKLATLDGDLRGELSTEDGRARWGMCSTAAPGSGDFERVLCSGPHSWRAVGVVTFETDEYPGVGAAEARGQEQCENAGNANADDPLDFQWGYEWPTEAQWNAGTTYGLCWVPDGS